MQKKIYKVKQADGRTVIVQSSTRAGAALLWGKSKFLSLKACEARQQFMSGAEIEVADEKGSSRLLVILSMDVFDQDEEPTEDMS